MNAGLNALLVEADLTYKQVVEANGLTALDTKRCSRQMRESKTGPNQDFYDAILTSVAGKIGRSSNDLHIEFDPQLERARNATTSNSRPSAMKTELGRPRPPRGGGQQSRSTVSATTRSSADASLSPELKRNAEWLAGLLEANDEQRAVDEMDDIFCFSDLVDVLIYLAAVVDPGMSAALLEEIRRRDYPRSSRMFAEISSRNSEIAERIAAVSPPLSGDGEFSVLEQNPMITFGRRLAGVIRKGDIARVRREIVVRTDDLSHGPESMLGGIIDSGTDGPTLAGKLLSALAGSFGDQMFLAAVQLIRHSCVLQRPNLLADLYLQLRPELRTEILVRLSHISRVPNEIGLEGDGIEDLAAFVGVQRQHLDYLSTAMLDPRLTRDEEHGVGHLVEAVTHLDPLLDVMFHKDRDQTTRVLASALRDWDQRLRPWTGIPDLYPPLAKLGEAVLMLPHPAPLVAEMITKHPGSGWLLFEALPWLAPQRFQKMLIALAKDYATVTVVLARMIMGMPDGRRQLRFCEELVVAAGESADPILRWIVAEHAREILDVLFYFEEHAPTFNTRMRGLLDDHGVADIREVIATNLDTGRREHASRPREIPIYISGPLKINDPLEPAPISKRSTRHVMPVLP
ncbi:hypothetical protein ACFWPX_33365 [Nocardia sp. NPDC058518]|uniref:hypothetical protein n=1 Tax=Nocardia sp. NPDC058518 TaxID=3346534 RepID=UPI00364E61F8